MYALCEKLFPYCRSITGNGTRQTLNDLQYIFPTMKICSVPSGTQVFDWVVPDEWNIYDAWIKNEEGEKIIDIKKSNLHVLGYAEPIDKIFSLEELNKILYTQPEQPNVIPYVTSYYKRRTGFCMSENQRKTLQEGKYHAFIDSEFKKGVLNYGEIIIPGESKQEILLSTYICHPSMANDNLSGIAVAIYLAKWIKDMKNRRYTYRILFVPETIGAITYISKHYKQMKENIIAGFTLSCVGDDKSFSYIESRYGNTLSDRVAQNVLRFYYPNYVRYTFLDRGSDERQYGAPLVDLPVCSICRTKHGAFAEYHTSDDNLELISPEGLQGAYEVYKKCVETIEVNRIYRVRCLGEPFLSKYDMYPTKSQKTNYGNTQDITNFIAYADGTNDLLSISDKIGVSVRLLSQIAKRLESNHIIESL